MEHHAADPRRSDARWWGAVLASTLVLVAVVLAAPLAAAQEDPYGSTTTTTAADDGVSASCEVEIEVAEPGASGLVHVRDVAPSSEVRVLIGGIESGRSTSPAASSGSTTDVDVPFVVPDLEPGTYAVTAVGVDFSAECTVSVREGTQVLGLEVERGGGGGLGGVGGSSSGRILGLPRTGVYVGGLVATALALLVVGWMLVRRQPEVASDHAGRGLARVPHVRRARAE